MTSAYCRSWYRKNSVPTTNIVTLTTADTPIASQCTSPRPSSAARSPSSNGATGLSRYNRRTACGTAETPYATGDAYSSSWIRNGSTYCTSRNRTVSAAETNPTPSPSSCTSSMSSGTSASDCTLGSSPRTSRTRSSITTPTAKSSSEASTDAAGRMIRGKYTFVTSAVLPISEMPQRWRVFWNAFQPRYPAKTNRKYGEPSLGRPATTPNTRVKIPLASSGSSTTHATPS